MSANLEQIVNFSAMSILVTLFTWIYFRDRQQRIGLWMIGWVAIFIHFASELTEGLFRLSSPWLLFLQVFTLEVAGVSFLLSVSRVYANTRRRGLYFLLVGLPSLIYLALYIWSSQ